MSRASSSTPVPTPPPPPPPSFSLEPLHPYLSGNALVCNDNLNALRQLPDECVDLVYLDPPFNSNHNYVAAFGDRGRVDSQLRDIWRWTAATEVAYQSLPHGALLNAINGIRLISGENSKMAAYAVFMGVRLQEIWRTLKKAGSIYLHCDPNANWCLRILLDTLFDEKQFRNEIVWHYNKWTNAASYFQRNHDTIFFYVKSKGAIWNKQYRMTPHKSKVVSRGWDSNVVQGGIRQLIVYDRDKASKEILKDKYARVVYRDNVDQGTAMPDVWSDINYLASGSRERLGYPTQKPSALLERIIKASSKSGDLVMDPFCGCGTAADAAAKLGRKYLGIDVSAIAVRVMEQRLSSRSDSVKPVVYNMDWGDYQWEHFEKRALMSEFDTEDGVPGWAWAEDKVAGLLNGVPNSKKRGDGGVDVRYFGEHNEVIPIQVKMYQGQVGKPEMQKLLGVQNEWQNKNINAPMSLMVTLYPPNESLRVYAAQQGRVRLHGEEYPQMQILSVNEMLTKGVRPKLPPPDPRSLVGDSQTRFAMAV